MPMPLEGLLVLDWTIWQQGPVCSAMLGDLGADVIKIEQAGSGDPGRYLAAVAGQKGEGRPNWYFEANNRNKKSITLDLKQPDALQVVYDLTSKADIFVQNFRFGVAERLGVGYDTLREINPQLIYASVTGYGPEGPDRAEPSFDHLGLARSGIMNATGEPDMPPLGIAGGIADQMGAVMMAYGILAALMARERHGVGQAVDASHLGSMMWLQGLSLGMLTMTGGAIPRTFRARAFNPLWNHYACGDGKWLALAMLQPDRYWADFARAIGREELVDDERFATMEARAGHTEACVTIIDEALASAPRDEWVRRLKESPGDFIFTIVNDIEDLVDDPQVKANDYIVDVEHPQFGTTAMVGLPVRLRETPGSIRNTAPELGQHTEEILMEVLGYEWDRISELRDKKVL
ncbi:MAG: carnitine dehydratase [Deltaproteobacteria bacterium]|nr:carnitine dehydratase [Deltaproteobacteria bacterium]